MDRVSTLEPTPTFRTRFASVTRTLNPIPVALALLPQVLVIQTAWRMCEDLGPCVPEIELSDGNERGRCAARSDQVPLPG